MGFAFIIEMFQSVQCAHSHDKHDNYIVIEVQDSINLCRN